MFEITNMQAANNPEVEQAVQDALANASATELRILTNINESLRTIDISGRYNPHLTVNDARSIIACLENPRFDTLRICNYDIHDAAVLNVFRDGLPLCTNITVVILRAAQLGNEDLDRLRPAFYNTSVKTLDISKNDRIRGQRGGEVLRDLLVGNDTLRELILSGTRIGPEVAIGLGQGLADNNRLQNLELGACYIGNEGLANLLLSMGKTINNSLLHLDLYGNNNIEGEEGGRQVSLLLQRCPKLKVLHLSCNRLGPLGAHALAPGLVAASHLESLNLRECGLGNDGVANLIPDGQVNRSLTTLNLSYNDIEGLEGGENVLALASRCTNLDQVINMWGSILSDDQQCRLDMLLDSNRLCNEALALAGSTFPILFQFVEKAHCHKHGLSAIFLILQNDGDDYFCTALNRAIEPTHAIELTHAIEPTHAIELTHACCIIL